MAQVIIPNIDEGVIERLKARAATESKSLEQKPRDILAEAAKPTRAELLEELRRIWSMSPLPPGAPRAEDLIRDPGPGMNVGWWR
jgi:plasmid stability protein